MRKSMKITLWVLGGIICCLFLLVIAFGGGLIGFTSGWRNPQWLLDGTKIGFVKKIVHPVGFVDAQYTDDLYIMNLDGSHKRRLVKNVGKYSWSPDGSRIAFAYAHGRVPNSLTIMNINKRHKKKLDLGEFFWDIAWSPDGTKILYWEGSHTYLINPDGSNKKILSVGHYAQCAWSPDGTKIAFINDISGHSPKVGKDRLFIIDLDSDERISLVKTDTNDKKLYILKYNDSRKPMVSMSGRKSIFTSFSWSPNGQKLVFSHNRSYTSTGNKLFLFDLTTKQITELADIKGAIERIEWSMDGSKIAFLATEIKVIPYRKFFDRREIGRLFLINPDGTGMRLLTDDANEYFAYLSRDNKILYNYRKDIYRPDGTLKQREEGYVLLDITTDSKERLKDPRIFMPEFPLSPDRTKIVGATDFGIYLIDIYNPDNTRMIISRAKF